MFHERLTTLKINNCDMILIVSHLTSIYLIYQIFKTNLQRPAPTRVAIPWKYQDKIVYDTFNNLMFSQTKFYQNRFNSFRDITLKTLCQLNLPCGIISLINYLFTSKKSTVNELRFSISNRSRKVINWFKLKSWPLISYCKWINTRS